MSEPLSCEQKFQGPASFEKKRLSFHKSYNDKHHGKGKYGLSEKIHENKK